MSRLLGLLRGDRVSAFDLIDGPSPSDFCGRCRQEPTDCTCPDLEETR